MNMYITGLFHSLYNNNRNNKTINMLRRGFYSHTHDIQINKRLAKINYYKGVYKGNSITTAAEIITSTRIRTIVIIITTFALVMLH